MKQFKKFLGVLMSCCLFASMLPINVMAEVANDNVVANDVTSETSEISNMALNEESNTVTVRFTSNENASLYVALYDNTGKMTEVKNQAVEASAEEQTSDIVFTSKIDLDKSYMNAFLLDSVTMKPLCDKYKLEKVEFNLKSSADSIFLGQDTLYLYVETDISVNGITVCYSEEGSSNQQEIILYDNGNSANADDMKGDGVYSGQIDISGSEEKVMSFTAKSGDLTSNTIMVKCYSELTNEMLEKIEVVDNQIDNLLSAEEFDEKTDEEKLDAVTELLDGMIESNQISSVDVDEDNSLVTFEYPGGILGGVMYGDYNVDSEDYDQVVEINNISQSNENNTEETETITEETTEETTDVATEETESEVVETEVVSEETAETESESVITEETTDVATEETESEVVGTEVVSEETQETETTDELVVEEEQLGSERTSDPVRNTFLPNLNGTEGVETNQQLGNALILNSFPSFETKSDKIEYRTTFYEEVKAEWDSAGLATTLDTQVTVEDYKNLDNYNVVSISTHGSTYNNIPVICLSEPSSKANDKKYEAELKSNQIAKVNGSYWIFPSFFTAQYGENDLGNTFIFSECCMAMGGGKGSNTSQYDYSMANAILGRGAKSYVAFHNSVFATYSRELMKTYVDGLIDNKTSLEAYDDAISIWGTNHGEWFYDLYKITVAQYYGSSYSAAHDIAYPVHNGGEEEVIIHDSLKNGGFEEYDSSTTSPNVWSCFGDIRTLTQLGDIKPFDESGKRMAIITTGIGSKDSTSFEGGTEGSMISQTFIVPENASKIQFSYDFVSEEPSEYVGSIYNDAFCVQIENSGSTVFDNTYESINTSEWIQVQGIDFTGGDSTVYHTEWKTAEIDVTQYRGSAITLSFIIYDVGDEIYDSACVIDKVVLK